MAESETATTAGLQSNGVAVQRKPKHGTKVFRPQESLYTQLYESNTTFRALYLLCVSQTILTVVSFALRDSLRAGRPYLDLGRMYYACGFWGDWWNFTLIECVQLTGFLLVHPAFVVWVILRRSLRQLADGLFVLLYIGYILVSGYFAHTALHQANLPPALKLVTSIEHMRVVMKSYSFIRENAYKVLYPWNKDDENGLTVKTEGQLVPRVGSFKQYFYFVFAPTLLYRDHYPRNQGPVRWLSAFRYLLEFVTINFVALEMMAIFEYPASMRLDDILSSYIGCIMFALINIFFGHADVLQLWQNFTAELTRFADREFYKDWWNSTSYSVYYRKWNMPIHDWVHTYLYRDVKAVTGSKVVAALPVFALSSVLHEFHLAAALGFYAPIFLLLFGLIGSVMFSVRPKKTGLAQMFTVTGVAFGSAIFIMVFNTELAARQYCPYRAGEEPKGLAGYFSYRTPYCYAQFNS